MLKHLLALALFAIVAAEDDDEVCFEPLGCFSMEKPWKTLLRPLPSPMSPEEIETNFYLYTRNSPERFNVITRPDPSVDGSDFDGSKPTFFITHGFSSNGNSSWLSDMKDALLGKMDGNVFLTDWGKGASTWNYLQVASNTRVVGKEMTRLLEHLIKDHNLSPGNVHLIGHSLGAQISSYAAKNTNGIGRITALDPAQPGFEGFSRDVRLDSSDATYVDVIHSDAKPVIPFLGFGMIGPFGDTDYYLNGGYQQPGCIIPKDMPNITSLGDLARIPVEVISNIVSCPHGRSYGVFTASIKNSNCTFWGHPVSILNDVAGLVSRGYLHRFLTPSNEDCTVKLCSPLGLDSINYPARGTFNVATTSDEPFCIPEPEVDKKMAKSLRQFEENKEEVTKRPGLLPSFDSVSFPSVLKPDIPNIWSKSG
ncbi:inactive pancreatic lipase-related protein 1 [Anabrus simplex]|uniref:inactive pancreatic lipase-related protein 1 n=1 Tax=Anabrus simplex TaxID=316456 RepID=UPI0035A35C2A